MTLCTINKVVQRAVQYILLIMILPLLLHKIPLKDFPTGLVRILITGTSFSYTSLAYSLQSQTQASNHKTVKF